MTQDRTGETSEEERWRAGMVAAQSGDTVEYEKLLEQLVPVIRRLVGARLANTAMVDDVVQNALLSIHRARHTYRPERPFGPWMRTVVRNATIDALRQGKRQRDREVQVEEFEWFPDPDAAVPGTMQGLSAPMREALESLPAKQREAVELIQLHGLSVAEAALKAKASPGAVKVRAHRGYRALREKLEKRKGEL